MIKGKKKTLFLLNGLTHYVIPILNKLNEVDGVEVIAVTANNTSNNIGAGVYIANRGIRFRAVYLDEIKRFYGKTFFNGFKSLLISESPDIIILGWPFILELVFNPLLLFYLKKNKIKIFFKEIPFQVQPFKDAIKFKPFPYIDENFIQRGVSLNERIKNFFIALIKRYYYEIIDLNLHYIEDGHKVLQTYGVSEEKIVVTLNSPDTDILFEAKQKSLSLDKILPDNPFRLIHVGRLVKWKRVDLVIEAVAKLSEAFSRIELIVVGDGPELNNLQYLTKELKVEHRINFIGAVYDPILLGRYFYCSSIYVLGGMGGLSINEAMVFGKPIVCSVCDGTEKVLVKDGYNGYIFMNGSLEGLNEKLALLLSDQKKIQNFGKNSLNIIQNKVNIHTVVFGYLKAISSIQ